MVWERARSNSPIYLQNQTSDMPSLFTQLQDQLESAGLDTAIGDQVATLTDAGGVLDTLASDPPSELGDMITALDSLSLPDITALDDLVGDADELLDLVPEDVTSALEEGFGDLLETLETDLVQPLADAIETIQSLAGALEGDAEDTVAATTRDVLTVAGDEDSPVVAAFSEISQMFEGLAGAPTVESFLRRLNTLLQEVPVELLPIGPIPFISTFQQQLATIVRWLDMDASQLTTELETTLQALAGFIEETVTAPIQPAVDEMSTLTAALPGDDLRTPMQDVEQGLREIAGIVASGDLSTAPALVGNLDTLLGEVNTTLGDLETSLFDGQTEALLRQVDGLPAQLERGMRDVLSTIDPPADLTIVGEPAALVDAIWSQEQADAVVAAIQNLLDGVQNVIDGLNLEPLRQPLLDVIDGAQSVVDALDQALVEVTTTLALLFDEVDAFLDGIDTEAVSQTIEAALTDVRDTITTQINTLFAPVQTALSEAVDALGSAVSAFDATAIIDALRQLIAGIAGLLEADEVKATIETATTALEEATQALEALSFQPVTDEVIGGIEDVTEQLQKIDLSMLPDSFKVALRAALSALPTDLQPITDPLLQELDQLIEEGPKPVLLTIKNAPERVAEEIQKFSPAALIGDQLAAPYREVIETLAEFAPSDLLQPVEDSLADLVARLEALDPAGALLEPLETAFGELMGAFDAIDIQALVQPLEEQVTAITTTLEDSLPLDSIFDQVDAVLATLQRYLNVGDVLKDVLQHVTGFVDGLGAPDQVKAIIDTVLSTVDQIADLSPLAPAFIAINDAVDAVTQAGLQSALVTPLSTLIDSLTTLDPGALHSDVVRAYRAIPRSAVEALPASPERDAILSFLDGFNPLASAFSRPFTLLRTWKNNLVAARDALTEVFTEWDVLYHGATSPFAAIVVADPTSMQLRDLLEDTIGAEFGGVLSAITELIARFRGTLSGIVSSVEGFVDAAQGKLAGLLLVPDVLQAIRDAIQALIDRVAGFDLSFLTDELQETYDQVKAKLAAFDPAGIRAAVEETYDAVIGALSVDSLLPQEEIEQIDAVYQSVLDTLRALDPETLIIEVVEPEYQDAIPPLLEVLHGLSDLVQTLIDRLDGLDEELNREIARTNEAFDTMIAAIPV